MKYMTPLVGLCAFALGCTPPGHPHAPAIPPPVVHDLGALDCRWSGPGDDVVTAVSPQTYINVLHPCSIWAADDLTTAYTTPGQWVQAHLTNVVRTDDPPNLHGLVCIALVFADATNFSNLSQRCVHLGTFHQAEPPRDLFSERIQSPGGNVGVNVQFWLDPNLQPLLQRLLRSVRIPEPVDPRGRHERQRRVVPAVHLSGMTIVDSLLRYSFSSM
jgi:hypothetical protein